MEDSKLAWIAKILPPSRTQMVINWLSLNLREDEYCVTHVSGSKNYASPSWFVLTNKRLIFTSNQLVDSINFGECFQEFDLLNIHDGHFRKKTFSTLGEIQIKVNSGVKVLDHVIPESGNDFVSSLLTTVKIRKQADGDIVFRKDDDGIKENKSTTFLRFQELNNLYHSGEISLDEYCAKRDQITNEPA
jgi:hypothetical protein